MKRILEFLNTRSLGTAVLLLFILSGKLIENVDNSEVVVIQSLTGQMYVYDQPGPVFQNFGTATHYRKSKQFWFSNKIDEGNKIDQSIKIRFNDGGHGNLSGSLRYNLPADHKRILALHTDFHSQQGIEQELIRQVITKSIDMTGPLMSS